MDVRLANTWRMTVNEKKFIETALDSNLRTDGRNPLEFRKLTIKFGREDGSSEVHLGQTHVMCFVTGQLVQPYRDRPNEGALSIFTEFSPMADPSFEVGRPGESAVELGRIIDRGLRESRAVDTESLCVLAGRLVWSIRVDLHIIDNGGNLVDTANIAALAALLTFRRPEVTLGGENGQEVIVHPPDVREPLPLIVHHLPIAVTFAFFGTEGKMVVDPSHYEEAVMGGKMTVTANANGDICSIQKAGGEGVFQSVIVHCLQLASVNAESITTKIKKAVEAFNTERALRKIKRHSTPGAVTVGATSSEGGENKNGSVEKRGASELPRQHMERLNLASNESGSIDDEMKSSEQSGTSQGGGKAKNFVGGASSWDPYPKGIDLDVLKASLATRGISSPVKQQSEEQVVKAEQEKSVEDVKPAILTADTSETLLQTSGVKTLKDAVKPKNRRRKKKAASSSMDTS